MFITIYLNTYILSIHIFIKNVKNKNKKFGTNRYDVCYKWLLQQRRQENHKTKQEKKLLDRQKFIENIIRDKKVSEKRNDQP